MYKGLMKETIALFDVDQTLAGGIVAAHLRVYNQALKLGMTPEEILTADRNYPKTFDVPQIKEARLRSEEEFQKIRNEIRTSPRVHLDLFPLPYLPAGVSYLLEQGAVLGGYYTVRPKEVEDASREWLQKNNFPQADKVVICENHADKLLKIAEDHLLVNKNGRNTVLIDDSFVSLLDAARVLTSEKPSLRAGFQKLIIAGFGMDNMRQGFFDLASGTRAISLPSWQTDHVVDFINNLRKMPPDVLPVKL